MESMKNRMFWGLAVMLAVLSSCQKEDRPLAGSGYRLTASTPATRLALEGDHSTVEWSEGDCLFLLPRNPQSAWEYPYTLNLDPQSLSEHNTRADFVYNKDYRASGWNMGRDLPAGEYDVVYVNPKLDMMAMMSTVDSLVFSVSLISQVSQFDPTGLQSASMYSPGTLEFRCREIIIDLGLVIPVDMHHGRERGGAVCRHYLHAIQIGLLPRRIGTQLDRDTHHRASMIQSD